MLGLGLGINKSSAPGELFSLDSALHQWSRENYNLSGNVLTLYDYGSSADSNISNVDASDLPIVEDNFLVYEAGDQTSKSVNDWEIAQTTGVFHCFVWTIVFCWMDHFQRIFLIRGECY